MQIKGGEKLEDTIQFAIDEIQKISLEDYSEDEFAIARMGFLSTRPNAHQLLISEDVLLQYAKTVLGKWVVADMQFGEPTTHSKREHIVGKIPSEQEVEFVKDEDSYLRAYVDVVISKIYAKDFCQIFEEENNRSVSVEMRIKTETGNGLKDVVNEFNIIGVTVLGKSVRPSCPESDITFVRFSEDEADAYFNKVHTDTLSALKNFVKERKILMAEKTYKIDNSKEAMSTDDWGDVDKAAQRDKIMEASNRAELVKAVYALVEDGWEDAPSEHLKYPLMQLKGDTFVYNRGALSSALAYAKQHDEQSVVDKVEAIYKDLDLELDGKEEDAKMSEIEFAAVDLGDMWGKLWRAIDERREWDYCIEGIYEEANQKFALLKDRDGAHYRLNFSLTEEGLTIADEVNKVEIEFIETDEIRKFAEPENAEEFKKFAEEEPIEELEEEKEVEMSADEMKAKLAEYEATITEKDNIIMEKDALIEELQKFKDARLEADKVNQVETVMSSVAQFMDKETADSYRQEGMSCEFAEIDAWSNKVKASVVDKVTKSGKKDEGFTRMSAPVATDKKKSDNVWDRI